MKIEQSAKQKPWWLLWGAWVLASVIGMPLGSLLGDLVNGLLWGFPPPDTLSTIITNNPIPRAFVIGLAIGFCTGVIEWVILRKMGLGSGWWIPASIVGWGIGLAAKEWAASLLTSPAVFGIHGIIAGILIGISQWLVLRRCVHSASLWIAALVTWDLGLSAFSSFYYLWEPILYSLMHGALTGSLLVYLVKYPAEESSAKPGEIDNDPA